MRYVDYFTKEEYEPLPRTELRALDKKKGTLTKIAREAVNAYHNKDYAKAKALSLTLIVRSRTNSPDNQIARFMHGVAETKWALSNQFLYHHSKKEEYVQKNLETTLTAFQEITSNLETQPIDQLKLIHRLATDFYPIVETMQQLEQAPEEQAIYFQETTRKIHELVKPKAEEKTEQEQGFFEWVKEKVEAYIAMLSREPVL